jgi:hypothetical protein
LDRKFSAILSGIRTVHIAASSSPRVIRIVILVLLAWKARIAGRSEAPEEGLSDEPKAGLTIR